MKLRHHVASAMTVVGCPALIWAALTLYRACVPMLYVEPIDTRDLISDHIRTGPTPEEVMQALDGHALDIETDPLSRPKVGQTPRRSWHRTRFDQGLPLAGTAVPRRAVASAQ
jgi:hypothetical protein